MTTFENYIDEAEIYYRIVSRNINTPNRLGNKTLLSLSSMIAEKYLVSYLMIKSMPVQGHSIKSLLSQIKQENGSVPAEISNLSEIDERLDLCSFNPLSYTVPDSDEMKKIFECLTLLKEFVEKAVTNIEN